MAKPENLFLTGQDSFKAYANQTSDMVERDMIPRGGPAKAFGSRTFIDHDTNISVRSDYNRADWEYFRPSYTVPSEQKEIISMCMEAYRKVGLVRNVIDLMADFCAQGIRIQHSIPTVQEFYNSWFEKVSGKQISERFLNLLYRAGQVVVKESYGKVNILDEKRWKKGTAQDEVKVEKLKPLKREIPLKYTFIDILSVEVLGQDLAAFVGQPTLALKLSSKLRTSISTAMSADPQLIPEVKKMLEKIPSDVLYAIKNGKNYVPLDMDKTSVYYYKKDDWSLWADPMCHAILDDLLMLNKLKLADISALDGAISNIRLWKLGIIGDSPNNSILPTKTAINKLRNILANNVGGGVLDLVWGPELSFEESNTQVWRFLGSEKYQITLNNIYEGLGIPPPLRAGKGQSNTGNFIGLNTLIKRLQYGRDRIVEFWTKQLKYIHKAMGFAGKPPRVTFDFMALADEAAEKQLLINLWDRDIISDETILELFGRLPNIEKSRVKREMSERENEVMPYKASPYHNPNAEIEYRKILLQGGGVAPSEIGIDLQDRNTDEQSQMEKMHEKSKELLQVQTDNQIKVQDMQNEFESKFKQQEIDNKFSLQKEQQKFKQGLMKQRNQGTPGRPKNVTETKKRKAKPTERPSTKAEFLDCFLWANLAQDIISEMVTKSLLSAIGKSTLRSLSKEEFDLVEKIKLDILCNFKPFEQITEEKIYIRLNSGCKTDKEILGSIKTLRAQFVAKNDREPKIDELRQIYSVAYSLSHEK